MEALNHHLEQAARALFKSWFVDFDPVRAKLDGRRLMGMDEATTKLFSDSFRNSELSSIPHGWEVGTLGDIATNSRRTIRPDEISPDTPYIAL